MKTKNVPIVPECSGGGNTITPPSPAIKWCFTYNNYTEDDIKTIYDVLCSKCSRFIIGKEIAPNTKTKHLQGYIEFKTKNRPSSLKLNNKIHWEKCKGTAQQNIDYCKKDGDYISNIKFPKPIKIIDENNLYNWQKELHQIITLPPDDRHIYWLWDPIGNIGKSAYCKLLCYKYNALIVEGKSKDINCSLVNYFNEHKDYPEIIVIDCPRHNLEYFNYGAIEKIKNGLVFSSKYESNQIIFNPPHIFIFANKEPDINKFSLDRWIIKELKL